MNDLTYRLIKLMRVLMLIVCVAGSVAALTYFGSVVFAPQQPGEVVALDLRQRAQTAEADAKALEAAAQRVAAGAPAEVLPRSTNRTLFYREANPVRRFALRLFGTRPQSLPYVLVTLTFCILLYQILRDIRPNMPFTPANVRRIRIMALLLIGSDVYHWVVSWWLRQHLAEVLAVNPTEVIPVTQFGSTFIANWIIGLVLFIMAAGYQRGVELVEEVELTV
jgi:hypothetical protein